MEMQCNQNAVKQNAVKQDAVKQDAVQPSEHKVHQ